MRGSFRWVGVVLLTGMFVWNIPQAHAIFGIRAARAALAARRANKAMNSSEEKTADTAQDKTGDASLGVSRNTTGQAPAFESENPNLEKLKQMEAESKRQS